LCSGQTTIDLVADSVGFKSLDAFRRAFAQRFRITPNKYQRSFGLRRNNRYSD
jgi:transcriptional regulator GlxA family with amidase domain